MSNSGSSNGGSVGIVGFLGILFVALKLLGFIDWSWWFVTLPFYGGIVLLLLLVFILDAFDYIKRIISSSKKK